jgi:glycogen synthase
MRILTLTNLFPPYLIGGYEFNCQRSCHGLSQLGHEVHILTSNHGLTPDTSPTAEPRIERSLRLNGYYGHPWVGIKNLVGLELHNNTVLRRKIAEIQPDIVYVWNMGGLSKSLLQTLEDLGIPHAFYISDHWVARSLTGDVWLDWWNRRETSAPARVLRTWWGMMGKRNRWATVAPSRPVQSMKFRRPMFCSKALKNITVAKGYAVEHGAVVHCPVAKNHYLGTVKPASTPLVNLLYVGRLAEDKGVMCALRAMLALKGTFQGRLSVYGRGDADYEKQLHRFVQKHNLPVSFHSSTAEQMPEVYREHDALLFTSEWEEPFALTPLEAMCCGLPVIGTTTGGSAELFRHGINALTYTAGNAKELAECVLALAADSSNRAAMAAQGQKDASSNCDEPIIVGQMDAYLKETVQRWSEFNAPAVAPTVTASNGTVMRSLQPAAA